MTIISQTKGRVAAALLTAVLTAGCSGGGGSGADASINDAQPTGAGTPGASTPGANKAPVARADTVAVTGAAMNIGVLANDSDPDGDAVAIASIEAPEHGVAVIISSGTETTLDDFVRYVPQAGFVGTDHFSYTLTDGNGNTAAALVSITVAQPANVLLAADDQKQADESTPVAIPVLANDASSRLTTLSIVSVSTPIHGSAVIGDNATPQNTGDDVVIYTPNTGYAGSDSFFYEVTDGTDSALAAVNVLVSNDPVVSPPSASVTGSVMVGPVSGALVSLYEIDGAGDPASVTPVVRTFTDAYGNWSADLPPDHGPMLIVASGGAFRDQTDLAMDPADRGLITLTADDRLESLLPAGEAFAATNVFTHALLNEARRNASGSGFEFAFQAARQAAGAAYGFDLVATPPDDPSAPDPASPPAARQYANALGGAAVALDKIVLSVGLSQVTGPAIQAIVRDLSACGLDGHDPDGPVILEVNGSARAIASQNLNLAILRFRNNNIDRYGATPPVDVDLPVCNEPGQPPTPPTGQPPALLFPGVDQSATEELAFSLDAGANFADPDGGTLSFSATGLPAGLSIDSMTGVIAGAPTNADALIGSFMVVVTANDGSNATSDTFTIVVANVNDQPVLLVPVSDQPAVENLALFVNLAAAFSDPDGDALSYSIAGLPAGTGLVLNPLTGVLSGTPTDADAIASPVTVVANVSDGSLTTGDTFLLTVVDVNNTPAATLLSAATVSENLPAGAFVGGFSTVDADVADSHSYSLVGGAGASGNGAFSINGNALEAAVSLDFETQASYSIRVRTSDGNGGQREDVFAITVLDGVDNAAPTTTGLADISVLEDSADQVLDLFAAFDDAEDADTDLTFTVTGNTNPTLVSTTVDGAAGTLRIAIAANQFGTADLTVRATDTDGIFVEDTLTIDVTTQADLSLTIGVDNPTPVPGEDVVFTIVLVNAGPSQATDFQVSVPLPAGYTYVTANNPGEYNQTTGIWAESAIGGTSTLTITATVNPTGLYDVVAELVAVNEPDPDSTPGNGAAAEDDYDQTTTSPRFESDLDLLVSVDNPVPESLDPIVLTVTVTNNGPYDVGGIAILADAPAGLSFDAVVPDTGTYNAGTGTWDGFSLANGASANLTIDATVLSPPGFTVTTGAEIVAADKPDPDTADLETVDITVVGAGVAVTWLGGDAGGPSDWSIGANWSTGTVPGPFDRITIPVTPDSPVLDTDHSAVSVDVRTGATLDLNGNALTIYGEIDADGLVIGACPASRVVVLSGVLSGNLPSVEIAGPVSGGGTTNIACDLLITAGRFHQGGKTVNVAGNFAVLGSGVLIQHHGGLDALHVQGDVIFNGADHSIQVWGQAPLIDGYIFVGGNFAQIGDPHAFAAERNHHVIFDGLADQTVSLANPDISNPDPDVPPDTGSRFAKLRIDKNPGDGVVDFLTNTAVLKRLKILEDFSPVLTSSTGSRIIAAGVRIQDTLPGQADSVTFDGLPLNIVDGSRVKCLDGARFTNMNPALAQITIVRSDLDDLQSDAFNNLSFETWPDTASGGRYIDATNTDADDGITLEVLGSYPAHGEPWTTTTGDMDIVWGSPADDTDGDTVTDADEFANGTNPRAVDTDADALSDAQEALAATDPNDPDSDGDGVGDGAEVAAGGDPNLAMPPGNIFYVRPAPAGDDANAGTGGWGDALATNAEVRSKLFDGAAADDPVYVLYEAGTYDELVIDHDNVSFVGSVGPGRDDPAYPPTTVFDVSATSNAPVVHVLGSTGITLQNLRLTGADNTGGGPPTGEKGGGLHVGAGSSAQLLSSVVDGNIAASLGAGFYVDTGAYLTVLDSLITGNILTGAGGPGVDGGGGGAVLGGLYMGNSIVAGNRAEGTDTDDGGGGLYLAAVGTADIAHSMILGNYASRHGGGFHVDGIGTGASLFNNLIAGNAIDSGLGGGVAAGDITGAGSLLIESNTVAYNQALTDGGGVDLSNAADTQVRDNIVWRNDDAVLGTFGQDNFVDRDGTALVEYNNLEDDPTAGANFNRDSNPDFVDGFYLDSSSPSVGQGSASADSVGLGNPFTTRIDGSPDTGVLDQGYHHVGAAGGPATSVDLLSAACASPGELSMTFAPRRWNRVVGFNNLGAGHVAAAWIGPASSTGTIDDRSTITRLQPAGATSRLAADLGDGSYTMTVYDVVVSSGSVQLEFEIDGEDDGLTLASPDLTTIPGC